jgi:hypothetical protein
LNARDRFISTLHFGAVDRVPFHDDEVREEVLERWRSQGMPKASHLSELFGLDRWETVPLNLGMIPKFRGRLRSRKDFERLQGSYDPDEASRYPDNWGDLVDQWRARDYPLGIDAWPGFLRPLSVSDPSSLKDLIRLMYLDPELLGEMTAFIADFSIRLAESALREVVIDYAIMREPIAENKGPVIPPSSFNRFVIPCYRRIARKLRSHGVDVIILSTSGNVAGLIPLCLEAGVNGLKCGGTRRAGIDYVSLRKRYGRRLLLIGGIDVEALTRDKRSIRAEILSKVPYLIRSGGYIPMVDNRVRGNVLFENYAYYRELVTNLAQKRDVSFPKWHAAEEVHIEEE